MIFVKECVKFNMGLTMTVFQSISDYVNWKLQWIILFPRVDYNTPVKVSLGCLSMINNSDAMIVLPDAVRLKSLCSLYSLFGGSTLMCVLSSQKSKWQNVFLLESISYCEILGLHQISLISWWVSAVFYQHLLISIVKMWLMYLVQKRVAPDTCWFCCNAEVNKSYGLPPFQRILFWCIIW